MIINLLGSKKNIRWGSHIEWNPSQKEKEVERVRYKVRTSHVYNHLKSHITKLEKVAMCLKLPSDVMSEMMKTHWVDAAMEAVISKSAEKRGRVLGQHCMSLRMHEEHDPGYSDSSRVWIWHLIFQTGSMLNYFGDGWTDLGKIWAWAGIQRTLLQLSY